MKASSFYRRAALRTAIALALATSAVPAMAKGKDDTNSPAFVAAAGPLQKTLNAAAPLIKKYQEAPAGAAKDAAMAELKAAFANGPAQFSAVAAAATTAQDKFVAGSWGSTVAAVLSDTAIQQRALQLIVDSGKASPAEAADNQLKLGVAAYQNKDYATATRVLTPLVASGYANDDAAQALALSYNEQNQPAQALDALKTAAAARAAAGGKVSDNWLLTANQTAYKYKLKPQGNEWAVLTVKYAPTPTNWLASAQLLRAYNGYTGQDSLDLSRLLSRAGALGADPRTAKDDYLDYIQTADARRQPGEVLAVIDAGLKSGAISASDSYVAETKALANTKVGPDKASLPGLYRDAQSPSSQAAVVAGTADAYLGYGDAAKAIELYKIALTRPGVDKPRVLTRLGIAQSDAGDYAGAVQSFAQVTGPRQPLAALWTVYVQQKGGLK